MNKEEAAALLEKINENRIKLDNCEKHFFDIGPPPYFFGTKFKCLKCQGTMDAVQIFRYCQGYKAAGENPNDIIPGYE